MTRKTKTGQRQNARKAKSNDVLSNTKLSASQKRAVTYDGQNLLVLAGAGSGKTRVLTTRYSWLVQAQGLRPFNILALTFTNDAATEMVGRIAEALGIRNTNTLWVGTFHAVCARILRDHPQETGFGEDFSIADAGEQQRLVRLVLDELDVNLRQVTPQMALEAISRWKEEGITPEDAANLSPKGVEELLPKVYALYQQKLREADTLDFGDLISEVLNLFANHKPVQNKYREQFQAVMVDEYQDTNAQQVRLIKALRGDGCSLTAVGDDDQAIYAWRGAKVEYILKFEEDFTKPHVVNLSDNYRSTKAITKLATEFVADVEGRRRKGLRPARSMDQGKPVTHTLLPDAPAEAAFVLAEVKKAIKAGRKLGDIAVLARAEWLLKPIEELLVKADIPTRVTSHDRFMDREEVVDMIAWLKLTANLKNDAAMVRILRQEHWQIADEVVDQLTKSNAVGGVVAAVRKNAGSKSLPPKTRQRLADIMRVLNHLKQYRHTATPAQLVNMALEESGYRQWLSDDDSNTARNKLEGLDRLMDSSLAGYEKLKDFIYELPFVDFTPKDEKTEAVQLMTAHAAKGLEFPVVFLVGWERDNFPHSKADPVEEVRLAYVMLTRGQEEVFITSARRRGAKFLMPSPFVAKLKETKAAAHGYFVSETG
tara:strand:- start:68662 stop:70623 length:1962 start_codon:yes stop_codon:yes gene_type:complete